MSRMRVLSGLLLASSVCFCISCGSNSGPSANTATAQGTAASTPTVEVATVVSKKLSIAVHLPGEHSRMKSSLSILKLPPSWIRSAWIAGPL